MISARMDTGLYATVVCLVVFAACSSSERPSDSEAEAGAFEAAPISVVTIDEMRPLIKAGGKSHVVVNLWATWCPPCVTEMPALAKFYETYKDRGVTFLSFSADDPSAIDERVRLFVNSYEIPFPVWVMDSAEPDALNAAFGLGWDGLFPTTFLFRPDGTLAQRWEGEVTYETLSEAVDAAENGLAPKNASLD